jgi:carbamoyl-phosphate synthase large subunit
MTVLFSSAGRRTELLRTFRRAYEELKLEGRILAVDADPLAPALQVADRSYLVPRADSQDYVDCLAALCQHDKVQVVFPLIDPEIAVLSAHRNELEAHGTLLGFSRNDDSIKTVTDKWRTVDLFHALDLRTPASWLPAFVPSDVRFPLVVKPRFGSASRDTFKVRNRRELEFFVEYVSDPIVQEFVDGCEITIDVVCDLSGKVLSVVLRKRLEVRAGEVSKGVTVHDDRILKDSVRICKALETIGPACIQCIVRDNVPHYTEVNSRFGGGFPLGVAAGANSPRLLLASMAGIPLEFPAIDAYQDGVYITRFDDAFVLNEEDRASISRRSL